VSSATETSTTAPSKSGPLHFAGMTGSSIAGRDAAPWITDFLNAAYYRHDAAERAVDDLRLAFCVLTTYWYRKGSGRRLHLSDLPAAQHGFWGQGGVAPLSMLHQLAERLAEA
jgi:hypothetical protein